ncbi:MAG: YdcF family protein [Clostridia bacterium]
MNIALIVFIVGMAWAVFLGFQIFSANFKSSPPKDSVLIVLGCQVKDDGPSLSLKQRLDVAYDYLNQNPESLCIVTGGKGSDEHATEASVEKEYLMEKGIDESRIFLEDKSIDTVENFKFSMDIIEENGLSKNIAVATQEFHMYRACLIASEQGLTPYPITASSNPFLLPAHFGRELLAMTKYYFMKLI